MTINTPSPSMGNTSCLLDENTIARIALACAGVSGDPTVAIGIETLGSPVAFVAAVHDGPHGQGIHAEVLSAQNGGRSGRKIIRPIREDISHSARKASRLQAGAPLSS